MRKVILGLTAALVVSGPIALAHDGTAIARERRITFPKTPDGRSVLAVDLHTHSVFSDGSVWPDIRVEEAKRDGLFAMAVSEHLEYQPHAADIPHPDRNRSYELAKAAAEVTPDSTGVAAQKLLVINGSEITKVVMPPGHINAVFITDANALKSGDVVQQLRTANAQGAFTFWNHPYWTSQTPNGVATMTPLHAQLIKDGLLHGIEVANGADISDESFQIALENNLTVLGTSDVHGLIDWEYDIAGGGHRTATLVLAADETGDGVKSALKAGHTVAVYNDTLTGRKENVEAVMRGALRIEVGKALPRTTVVPVSVINDGPTDIILENVGREGFYDEGHVFTVKAGSTFTLIVKDVADASSLNLTFNILNTYIAPRQHLQITLADAVQN